LMPQSRILKAGDQVPITPIDQPPFVDSRPDSPELLGPLASIRNYHQHPICDGEQRADPTLSACRTRR
jgi:hypothetical protein